MSETQESHFTERISNLGIIFLISALMSFFGFNNYAPFSYFTLLSDDPMQAFFNPDISWYVFVIIWSVFPLTISIRLFRYSYEIQHTKYRNFGLLLMVSNIINFLMFLTLMILSLSVPWSIYYPYQVEIGIGYLVINTVIQTLQIIAWFTLYIICKKEKSNLSKDIQLNFGGIPMLLIIANVIFIGAMATSFTATVLLYTSSIQWTLFTMIGTYASLAWVLFTTIGNLVIGIRILNKPTSGAEKILVTKKVEIKKVKLSCPVCRNTIYEGQTMCTNCGYRI